MASLRNDDGDDPEGERVAGLIRAARAGDATPLVAVYPLLVAAAGLWLDRRVLRTVAVACLVAYGALVARSDGAIAWHVAAIVAVLVTVTAAISDFQVARVRAPRPADGA